MVFCCTSSSSVPWWTTRAPSEGPPLASILGNCRCFIPNVFALLTRHLGTLQTRKFTIIWAPILYRPYQISNWEIRFKVSCCGETLSYAAWQIFTVTERRPQMQGDRDRQLVLATLRADHVDILNSAQMALFDYLTEVFRAFSSVLRQMPGYNAHRRGTARTLPT